MIKLTLIKEKIQSLGNQGRITKDHWLQLTELTEKIIQKCKEADLEVERATYQVDKLRLCASPKSPEPAAATGAAGGSSTAAAAANTTITMSPAPKQQHFKHSTPSSTAISTPAHKTAVNDEFIIQTTTKANDILELGNVITQQIEIMKKANESDRMSGKLAVSILIPLIQHCLHLIEGVASFANAVADAIEEFEQCHPSAFIIETDSEAVLAQEIYDDDNKDRIVNGGTRKNLFVKAEVQVIDEAPLAQVYTEDDDDI